MVTFEIDGAFSLVTSELLPTFPTPVDGDVLVTINGTTTPIETLPTPIPGTRRGLVTLSDAEAIVGAHIIYADQGGLWGGVETFLVDCSGTADPVDVTALETTLAELCAKVEKIPGVDTGYYRREHADGKFIQERILPPL